MIPPEKHEITIVLTPFERYSGLDKAMDRLMPMLEQRSMRLIVLEAGAPDSIRASLEKRQKKTPKIKILYTHRPLSSGALMNFALHHVDTPTVLYLGSDVLSAQESSLVAFMDFALAQQTNIVSAPLRKQGDFSSFILPEYPVVNAELVFFQVSCLKEIGAFNENLPHFLLGLDILSKADGLGKTIKIYTENAFFIPQNFRLNRPDLKLFFRQWNVTQLKRWMKSLDGEYSFSVQSELLCNMYRQQRIRAREGLRGPQNPSQEWTALWPFPELRGLAKAFITSQ